VTSSRHIQKQTFFPNQNKNEIFQEIEKLKEKNSLLEEHNKNLENKVSDLEIRIESLYRDKEDLETYLENLNDNEKEELTQMKEKIEEKMRQRYEKEIEMLRESMGEMGHQNIKLEIKIKELEERNKELSNQKEIWEDREKYYKKHFIHRDKYETLNTELSQFKTENNSLDSRIIFRNMRVKELEKKIQLREQEFKMKIMDVEEKLKKKLKSEKLSAEKKIKKLNEELSEARTALTKNGGNPLQDTEKM